jgi:hypothetical protein
MKPQHWRHALVLPELGSELKPDYAAVTNQIKKEVSKTLENIKL